MTRTSKTIEPDVQEVILNILPEDGKTAIEVMCQLLANMILSIPDTNVHHVTGAIQDYLGAYEGT